MFKETMTVLAIIAGFAATSASARDGGDGMQARFVQMDADGNGEVTAAEMQAQFDARFVAADADQNGALSQDELAAEMQERHKDRLLKRFDTDNDGVLSDEEMSKAKEGKMGKRSAKRFDRMDADNSGDLSPAEMKGRRDPVQMVAKLDADKNGSLSLEEFSKARGHGKDKKQRKAD